MNNSYNVDSNELINKSAITELKKSKLTHKFEVKATPYCTCPAVVTRQLISLYKEK